MSGISVTNLLIFYSTILFKENSILTALISEFLDEASI